MFASIINILALVIPLFIGTSEKLFKGNTKRWILAIVVYFILKKWAAVAAADKAISDLQQQGGGLNANAIATLYKQAMNPTGYLQTIELDGTNEDLIFKTAALPQNYRDVFAAYQTAFKRNLTTDLQQELSTEDYAKFINLLAQ
ncbi:MAG: hypothetical protein ABIN80_28660 [Dyadobacter sp.]|uniref:hypothetical protein n=1 Tax=Dyadobacter sp. TaxID=1914288 RepID=UPI003265CC28